MSSTIVIWAAAMLAVGGGTPTGVVADPGARAGTVTGIQVLPALNNTEILISLSGLVETRDFTMQGPDRIVVDLMNASLEVGRATVNEAVNRGGLRRISMSQYAPDIVRLVLEVDGALEYGVIVGEEFVRLSMANPWGDFDFVPWAAGPIAPRGIPLPAVLAAGPVGAAIAVQPEPTPFSTRLQAQLQAPMIDVDFDETPMSEVVRAFVEVSGRSIVIGPGASVPVTAALRPQPWDVALQSILDVYGFAAEEQANGNIYVVPLEQVQARAALQPLQTQSFRVNYASAVDLQPVIESLLTERGQAAISQGTNNIVVTDVPRVLAAVSELLVGLDTRPASISIAAKIVFVDRTDLNEFGIVYDMKDSRGNQLNQLTPGGIDRNGDGVISVDEDDNEIVAIGTNVISLGGSSIAALGNANQRVAGASLQFLTSIMLGRHSLVSFLEALQSVQLSDIQAAPQTTGVDNRLSELVVGERTPLRVLDAGTQQGGGQGGAQQPVSTVSLEETGIILRVTPHVTTGDLIWMELEAERSGIAVAEADLGFTFDQQRANTQVLVADGETAVIGGLTVTELTESRAGIPLLQDLPLIGRFFRLTRSRTDQRDLIILVTPQIIRD